MKVIKVTGDYRKLHSYLEKLLEIAKAGTLDKFGREGVQALQAATPVDTGKTAASWSYSIERNGYDVSLIFSNSNNDSGANIAILLQYDHYNTKSGGIIKGIDYINPALRPVFEKMADDLWKEVVSA